MDKQHIMELLRQVQGGQVDLDGELRVLYDNVDMGADEVFPVAGDVDVDGDVDPCDFGQFADWWLAECVGESWCTGCDVDMSGRVDLEDFSRLAGHWLKGVE